MTIPSLGNAKSISVFAPASVGNVAIGFDVVGHALAGIGDIVRVERGSPDSDEVTVQSVSGCVDDLPRSASDNTAAAAVKAMKLDLDLAGGFDIHIEKGIPLGSGMGGSAASAAAAVVAVNMMLKIPLNVVDLYSWALAGEAVAAGEAHGDNVGPALIGGLTVSGPAKDPMVLSVPVPNQLRCVVVRPELRIDTRDSRSSLPEKFPRADAVAQMANLSAFLVGCFQKNIDIIERSLVDVMIEPHRRSSIPGFDDVKAAAMDSGAMGCSLSGAGPSMFAWFRSEPLARAGCDAMVQAFADNGISSHPLVCNVNNPGARPA